MSLPWKKQTPDTQSIHKFNYLECEFSCWEDLRNFFFERNKKSSLMNYVFRGHSDSDWKLEPSLERIKPKDAFTSGGGVFKDWYNNAEVQSIEAFRGAFRHYATDGTFPEGNPKEIDWLSVMQHHGAKTRLLDVSSSPFIAAFFAMSEMPISFPQKICIWTFDFYELHRLNELILTKATGQAHVNFEEVYKVHFLSPAPKNLIAIEAPKMPTMRQFKQQGKFLYAIDNSLPFEEVLAQYPKDEPPIAGKLILSIEDRSELVRIQQEFRMLGLTNSNFFPDLDGYAREIAQLQYRVNS
jgi:hypothetical protein